ncbi:methylphosphonate synthase [Caudoviricetes sp.]|nr:methylphosphonate synthase [Caudoviricetes sp.]
MTFPPIPETDLADRLRETMERNGHTLEQAAFLSRVSNNTIIAVKNHGTKPRYQNRLQLEEYIRNYSKPAPKPLEPCAWIPKPLLTH